MKWKPRDNHDVNPAAPPPHHVASHRQPPAKYVKCQLRGFNHRTLGLAASLPAERRAIGDAVGKLARLVATILGWRLGNADDRWRQAARVTLDDESRQK